MKQLPENTSHVSPIDAIRQVDEQENEYWSARDMSKLLGYAKWENFVVVIKRAMKACENSGEAVSDHFPEVRKMIKTGKGAIRTTNDFYLTRHACYLLVENADPDKPVVALGQAYFSYQTRRQELSDEEALAGLTENQRRLLVRGQLTLHNKQLAETVSHAGVVTTHDFAIFQDYGYSGLYGGLRAKDIHERKNLKRNQKILDHMGSTELAANLFRATQTDEQIRRESIKDKDKANDAHHTMGKRVRQFIKEGGGTMPEDLPTPEKSIQQVKRDEQKHIGQRQQPSLFDDAVEE